MTYGKRDSLTAVLSVALGLAASVWTAKVQATTITLDPSGDGAIYTCDGCNPVSDDAYVLVAGYIQGVVKFSMADIGASIAQATLSLNPYGLPLFDLSIDVYGYGTITGDLTAEDGFAGTYIGTWDIPADLGYGEDTYFDVTAFVATVDDPYVAFNLRSDTGTDVFSSLEYNYGHPSQLAVTAVPLPPGIVLIVSAVLGMSPLRKRSRLRVSP
jgi:hypothetical protein